ncbi:small-conductance mechanosensitive channel [Neomicrococcus aestuarii]|uniref:Small-conductance mechanosensitive channel n=1 Tax=Neomicrococcus aestuarii TaxID=556325 RepID=A0A7W8TWB6_9MICC|nr:mechanosensitive ion channel domain-containing protein [Neomicrococcus aestuarii]MBB5513208.1 small-conductance mechanosensitive channel [Neomicrococcus aestuarii]
MPFTQIDTPTLQDVPADFRPWLATLIALVLATVLTLVLRQVFNRVYRDDEGMRNAIGKARLPFFLTVTLAGAAISTTTLVSPSELPFTVSFLLWAALVVSLAWLLVVVLSLVEATLLAKYEKDHLNEVSRFSRMKTQVTLIRRVITAVVLLIAVAAILLLIPQVRAVGAGLLASAGLVSVIAGLAVQGTLSNVFAGLQIAFTEAVRVDDTVVVEAQQGVIEDITLTYVVVRTADGRRIILPSTYFTTTPFENWSRGTAELNGNIVLDLNWTAPVDEIRRRVTQLLESTDLWDGRTNSVQVTDAIGGMLKLTIVVSARNSGDLWELKNFIRERVTKELQQNFPEALPRPAAYPPSAPAK